MSNNTSLLEGARPSRRTLARGAAWSIPVISAATAAPAFAVSPCDTPTTGTVNFAASGGNYTRLGIGSGRANVTMADGSALVVTFASTVTAGYTRQSTNFEAGSASFVPGSLGLLQQRTDGDASTARGQDVLISFDRPVFNLSLPLSAFSWPANNYQDAAWVSPTPTNRSFGGNVTGAGSTGDPFRNPATGESPAVPYQGATTTVTLTYSGGTTGLSSVTVHYYDRAAGTDHAIQGLAIQNMSFSAKKLGCA